jgi:transposase
MSDRFHQSARAAEKQDRLRLLHLPEWLIELRVRFHKEGSTKMSEDTMTVPARQLCAGIDVGKAMLDVALSCGRSLKRFANTQEGHGLLVQALAKEGIGRAGLEATGGYEAEVCRALRTAGLEVHVFQPLQVRAYATFKLQRAKTDRLDALLIAQATAELKVLAPPPDARLQALSQPLTLVEQLGEDIARAKTRAEHVRDERLRAYHAGEVKRLRARMREELKRLEDAIASQADLASRLTLITSIRGVGLRTAIALVIRMPELGSISNAKAAALLGVAPVPRESGAFRGERHVAGGRMRPRTAMFTCTQAAITWNADLKTFYKRLKAHGKHHRCAVTACSRKLLITINAVLRRGQPWQDYSAPKAA